MARRVGYMLVICAPGVEPAITASALGHGVYKGVYEEYGGQESREGQEQPSNFTAI